MNPYLQDIRSLFEAGLDLSALKGCRILINNRTVICKVFTLWCKKTCNSLYKVWASSSV